MIVTDTMLSCFPTQSMHKAHYNCLQNQAENMAMKKYFQTMDHIMVLLEEKSKLLKSVEDYNFKRGAGRADIWLY